MHKKRIAKLQKQLEFYKCDAFLIEDVTDLYYLTGMSLSVGTLLVEEDKALLLVDARYLELCQKGSSVDVALSTENPLDTLVSKKKLGFCQANTTYERYLALKKIKLSLKPILNPVRQLRMVKDNEEIHLMRQAAKLGCLGFDFLCEHIKEGITEIELAVELEIFWKRKGAKSLAFDPIVAFGKNGSMPHYKTGGAKLKKGDAVLLDIGVNWQHYNSDMTRVVFFGAPKGKILEIYEVVHEAQLAALKLCKPGAKVGELDQAARGYIASKGYGEHFTHSLGHGIGLDVHEAPTLRSKGVDKDLKLEKGMVITIEPGIYLPDVGGVRIEDTVIITDSGHENLTERSKEVKIC